MSYNDRELRVVRDAAQPTGLTASGFLAVAGLAFAGTRVSPPTSTERALLSEALRLGAVLTDYAHSLKEATAVVNNHGAGVSIAVLSALAGCTRAAAHVDEFTVQLMQRVR